MPITQIGLIAPRKSIDETDLVEKPVRKPSTGSTKDVASSESESESSGSSSESESPTSTVEQKKAVSSSAVQMEASVTKSEVTGTVTTEDAPDAKYLGKKRVSFAESPNPDEEVVPRKESLKKQEITAVSKQTTESSTATVVKTVGKRDSVVSSTASSSEESSSEEESSEESDTEQAPKKEKISVETTSDTEETPDGDIIRTVVEKKTITSPDGSIRVETGTKRFVTKKPSVTGEPVAIGPDDKVSVETTSDTEETPDGDIIRTVVEKKTITSPDGSVRVETGTKRFVTRKPSVTGEPIAVGGDDKVSVETTSDTEETPEGDIIRTVVEKKTITSPDGSVRVETGTKRFVTRKPSVTGEPVTVGPDDKVSVETTSDTEETPEGDIIRTVVEKKTITSPDGSVRVETGTKRFVTRKPSVTGEPATVGADDKVSVEVTSDTEDTPQGDRVRTVTEKKTITSPDGSVRVETAKKRFITKVSQSSGGEQMPLESSEDTISVDVTSDTEETPEGDIIRTVVEKKTITSPTGDVRVETATKRFVTKKGKESGTPVAVGPNDKVSVDTVSDTEETPDGDSIRTVVETKTITSPDGSVRVEKATKKFVSKKPHVSGKSVPISPDDKVSVETTSDTETTPEGDVIRTVVEKKTITSPSGAVRVETATQRFITKQGDMIGDIGKTTKVVAKTVTKESSSEASSSASSSSEASSDESSSVTSDQAVKKTKVEEVKSVKETTEVKEERRGSKSSRKESVTSDATTERRKSKSERRKSEDTGKDVQENATKVKEERRKSKDERRKSKDVESTEIQVRRSSKSDRRKSQDVNGEPMIEQKTSKTEEAPTTRRKSKSERRESSDIIDDVPKDRRKSKSERKASSDVIGDVTQERRKSKSERKESVDEGQSSERRKSKSERRPSDTSTEKTEERRKSKSERRESKELKRSSITDVDGDTERRKSKSDSRRSSKVDEDTKPSSRKSSIDSATTGRKMSEGLAGRMAMIERKMSGKTEAEESIKAIRRKVSLKTSKTEGDDESTRRKSAGMIKMERKQSYEQEAGEMTKEELILRKQSAPAEIGVGISGRMSVLEKRSSKGTIVETVAESQETTSQMKVSRKLSKGGTMEVTEEVSKTESTSSQKSSSAGRRTSGTEVKDTTARKPSVTEAKDDDKGDKRKASVASSAAVSSSSGGSSDSSSDSSVESSSESSSEEETKTAKSDSQPKSQPDVTGSNQTEVKRSSIAGEWRHCM